MAAGRGRGWSLASALALLACGCVFDSDRDCGPNQVLQQDGLCRCAEGSSLLGNECVPQPVMPVIPEVGLGAACDELAKPCTDPLYPSCQTARNGDRYCTSTGCTSSTECPEGYFCNAGTSPSHCRRPYLGQGVRCETSAQCVGFDASGCATLLRTCAVVNCTETTCDPGYTCFDASILMAGLPKLCVHETVF